MRKKMCESLFAQSKVQNDRIIKRTCQNLIKYNNPRTHKLTKIKTKNRNG